MSPRSDLCRACGSELLTDARFCDQCGAPVEGGAETPPCPSCAGPTERAGVAAERLANPRETGDTAAESDEEETAREELAGWLARPEEPKAFSLLSWIVVLLIPFVNVLSVFIAPFTQGLKLFMAAAGLVWVGVVVWYASGTFEDPFAAQDAAIMTGVTTVALYLLALFYSWRVERRDVKARRLPAWRRSVERWEHLVYCDPCGTVFFDDAEDAPVPAARVPRLLGSDLSDASAGVRTPLWLWALLAAVAVGGGRTAVSMAREANAGPEPLGASSSEMWEDVESDPVTLDTTAADSAGLDGPLLAPDTAPAGTRGR